MDWTATLSDASEARLARLADLGERALALILFSGLVARVLPGALRQPWNLTILVPEGLAALFMVIRRRPQNVTDRPFEWFVAVVGVALPQLVAPGGKALIPPGLGSSVVLAGVIVSVWGKLALRRSFGLAAAHRGLVEAGPYGLVRHPIYAGYFISYVGFLLLNPTLRNLAIYALAIVMAVARMRAEERVLSADPRYADFAGKVRWRIAPGLY